MNQCRRGTSSTVGDQSIMPRFDGRRNRTSIARAPWPAKLPARSMTIRRGPPRRSPRDGSASASWHDVPKDACFVAHEGKVYVWVTKEHCDDLSKFTMAILDIATAIQEPQTLSLQGGGLSFSPGYTAPSKGAAGRESIVGCPTFPLHTFSKCVGVIERGVGELPVSNVAMSAPRRVIFIGRAGCGAFSPSMRGSSCHPVFPWSKMPPAAPGEAGFAPSVNDLAIRVGTVNGSGSQSANLVLLRALYAHGNPVQRQKCVPLEHRGLADLVPHPRQRQGIRRPPARPADPRLHERADRQGRRRSLLKPGRSASIATISTSI